MEVGVPWNKCNCTWVERFENTVAAISMTNDDMHLGTCLLQDQPALFRLMPFAGSALLRLMPFAGSALLKLEHA